MLSRKNDQENFCEDTWEDSRDEWTPPIKKRCFVCIVRSGKIQDEIFKNYRIWKEKLFISSFSKIGIFLMV